MVFIDHSVPQGVQLIHVIVIWKREIVASSISSRVLIINPIHAVKGLVVVTDVVNEEAESDGFSISLVVVVQNLLVGGSVLVAGGLLHPSNYVRHGNRDIQAVELVVRVVVNATSLIKPRLIDVVPLLLPGASMVLDVVREGGTLNKWILVLLVCQIGLVRRQNL